MTPAKLALAFLTFTVGGFAAAAFGQILAMGFEPWKAQITLEIINLF